MRSILFGMAALLVTGSVAMAQSANNATISGTQTAPSNGQGAPGAAAPTGQMNTAPVGVGTPQLPGDKAAGQPTTMNSASAPATTTK